MNVWTYFLRRIASIPPTILIVLFFIFLIFSLVGNPNSISSQFPTYTGSVLSFLKAYAEFTVNIITGNWGYLGALPNHPTFSGNLFLLVSIYFFATLQVIIFAAPIGIAISFPLGRYLGTHFSDKSTKVLRGVVIMGYLTPAYIVAIILQIVLGRGVIQGNPVGVFPVLNEFSNAAFPFGLPSWIGPSGGILITGPTHMMLFDALIHGDFLLAENTFMHMLLPVFTMVISITGVVTFLLESGYVDNMGKEYVKGARSKGLREKDVVIKHVRRNAVMPVMASTTIMVAYLLSNIVMMEYVFNYPGIGLFLYTTMTNGQYYPTAVVIFLLSFIVIFMGLVIDVVNYMKNPLLRS